MIYTSNESMGPHFYNVHSTVRTLEQKYSWWVFRVLSEKAVAPHSSTLAWKIHGQRSLVGCSPWGRWGLDTTELLHFHFSLLFIGEGNGNPLQCSCLENPRGGRAWWTAIYGVSQSRTRLKWLSSSSNSRVLCSVTLSCPTLCDPMDCSAPVSSVHGLIPATILE